MSRSNWEAEKMLDVYVYDYFVKRNLHATARNFLAERKISTLPVAIDAPGGFLFEWWSVFWDTYTARIHEKRSNAGTSYAEGHNQHQFGFNHWPKPWMQSYHPSSQLQLQEQSMPQAQPMTSPSVHDLESRKLRVLLQKQSLGFGIDQMITMGDVLANVRPTAWIGHTVPPCGDVDVLLKQPEYPQGSLLNRQHQNSSIPFLFPDRVISSGGLNADGSLQMTFKEHYQASQKETAQKRKRPDSASFPAKHLRNVDAFGLFPPISSTPSIITLDDKISVPPLPQTGHSSMPLPLVGSHATVPVSSATSRLTNVVLDDASLADNNESISCYEDLVTRDKAVSKGLTITEFHSLSTSPCDFEVCHFSYDGKLLATGGHDKRATFWCTESLRLKSKLEEHSESITDARFSTRMPRFATSSADKTVRIWDADNPDYSLRTFTGHSFAVTSLDFHPRKDDLIFSCDSNTEIRYWSIKSGRCVGIIKGGSSCVRFQPRVGRFLAAAAKNVVSILDVETQVCRMKLQGHEGTVNTVCWDSTGEHLASVSDDLVKVWKIGSTGDAECVRKLVSARDKFHAFAFHPTHPSAAIIACSENLELWDIAENKKGTLHPHDGPISCLAASSANGLIASASRDNCIKIWK
ncbi:transcriptional corepressor LEUNIG-like isoform X2 [Rhodamnia argentea]|uniref:Transcriptional corepressor LEUNIG-like isoform X2 n=1 Tax=Rhodamnia argentea TaxID=178133 RepID=A0A8B8R0J1_9MYRT|nr:transcriptional corepressor LEUNIG-like isoform X2 [Rhodamnia argentea]